MSKNGESRIHHETPQLGLLVGAVLFFLCGVKTVGARFPMQWEQDSASPKRRRGRRRTRRSPARRILLAAFTTSTSTSSSALVRMTALLMLLLGTSCSAGGRSSRRLRSAFLGAATPRRRGMVTLHGSAGLSTRSFRTANRAASSPLFSERTHAVIGDGKPPDPSSIGESQIREAAERLADWLRSQRRQGRIHRGGAGAGAGAGGGGGGGGVVCLTGAGISTESGIPDYRGARGSYHAGHRPMRHDEFLAEHSNRQRYWGRGMVGWRYFDQRQPAAGHRALAALRSGHLGVNLEDRPAYYADADRDEYLLSSGQRSLSLITQNVDALHRRAGTRHLVELHGRTDRLDCQRCGAVRGRRSFHRQLELLNAEWLLLQQQQKASSMRADGDASVATQDFSSIRVPPCDRCGTGFYKPAVVFFGDSVPGHRVRLCEAAVAEASGLLVVGSSLAVHSAFRHVRAAAAQQTDICILNVGPTRAEVEGLPGIFKLEAPAGPVLERAVQLLGCEQEETRTEDVVLAPEVLEEQAASR